MQVFKVQLVIKDGSAWKHAVVDLIFQDGLPHAVLEWGGAPGNETPRAVMPLDSTRLQEFRSGAVTHLYDGYIVDPRPRH
jgi:hypothetical protein